MYIMRVTPIVHTVQYGAVFIINITFSQLLQMKNYNSKKEQNNTNITDIMFEINQSTTKYQHER